MAKKVCDYKQKYQNALILLRECYDHLFYLEKTYSIHLNRLFANYPFDDNVMIDLKKIDPISKVEKGLRKEIIEDINKSYQ